GRPGVRRARRPLPPRAGSRAAPRRRPLERRAHRALHGFRRTLRRPLQPPRARQPLGRDAGPAALALPPHWLDQDEQGAVRAPPRPVPRARPRLAPLDDLLAARRLDGLPANDRRDARDVRQNRHLPPRRPPLTGPRPDAAALGRPRHRRLPPADGDAGARDPRRRPRRARRRRPLRLPRRPGDLRRRRPPLPPRRRLTPMPLLYVLAVLVALVAGWRAWRRLRYFLHVFQLEGY